MMRENKLNPIFFLTMALLMTAPNIFSTNANSIQPQSAPIPPKDLGVEEVKPYDSFQLTTDTYEGRPFNYSDLPPTSSDKKSINVLAYFSPTCHHCQKFFKDIQSLTTDYIANKKMYFFIRPYCMRPLDFIITQIAMGKGENSFLHYFIEFFEKVDLWIPYVYLFKDKEATQEENNNKLDELNKLVQTLKLSADVLEKSNLELHEKFKFYKKSSNEFDVTNTNTSIILVALSLGITPQEINEALEGAAAEDIKSRLILTTLQALDEKNEKVGAIPVFYVDSKFQGAMSYNDLIKLIDDPVK